MQSRVKSSEVQCSWFKKYGEIVLKIYPNGCNGIQIIRYRSVYFFNYSIKKTSSSYHKRYRKKVQNMGFHYGVLGRKQHLCW